MAVQARHATGVPEKAALRRVKALELRAQGQSLRAIADALGVCVAQAHNDLRRALEELAAQQRDRAHVLREEEVAKLDRLEAAWLPRAQAGDERAVDRAVRIMERRSRLLGLDAPTKIAPTTPDGENSYAAIDDQQLRADLVKLVAAFTGGHGSAADPPVAGGGEVSLDAVGTPESTPAAG